MKTLILLLSTVWECSAQSMIVPPTNTPEYFPLKQVIPNPNPQPMGDWTNLTLAWDASPSPGIDHYNVYLSPTFKPWNGRFVGSTTNLSFKLYIGGTMEGFPGVSAVNKSGIESAIKL